jgi:hypothetical protein
VNKDGLLSSIELLLIMCANATLDIKNGTDHILGACGSVVG